ncbi:MAG: hypothetical protein RSG52_05845 [Terrisporobacter sp.]|uniref:hypothetical protein n=1 Tax=Terrisporobacter sp. TaxID=1965305 RepID=UPI002FCB09A2
MGNTNTYSTHGDSIEMLLRQIGATSITRVRGYLYFIKFQMDDLEITYTYNINHKDQFFLQRINPYPLGKGIFKDEFEIVEFIKKDLKKFRAAHELIDFDKFLEINTKINNLINSTENLFLNYDVRDIDISELENILEDYEKIIESRKSKSKKVK